MGTVEISVCRYGAPPIRRNRSAAVQLRGHGHRVGGLTAPVQVQDRVVDVLMRGAVEVAGAQPLQHVGDGVLAQQHAAEDGLLGRDVLGRLPTEVLTGRRRVHPRMAEIIYDSHGSVPPPLDHRTYIRLPLSVT